MARENEAGESGTAGGDTEGTRSPEASVVTAVDQEFARFDRDGDGSIDFDEFSDLVTHLGLGRGKTITRKMFDSIDRDANGRISAGEFTTWWAEA